MNAPTLTLPRTRGREIEHPTLTLPRKRGRETAPTLPSPARGGGEKDRDAGEGNEI